MDKEYYYKKRRRATLSELLRNILITWLPEQLAFITRKLVPFEPDFIFFTHPRNADDVISSIPLAAKLKRFLPNFIVERILDLSPCYIISHIYGPGDKKGYFVSVTRLPQDLFRSVRLTKNLVRRSSSFFKKISKKRVYVGLAAWWPIVTNSGLLFNKYLDPNGNVKITSGHTATLASIYLSILKISEVFGIPLPQLRVLIIGVGKVGGSLCELLGNKIGGIGLVDKNNLSLRIMQKKLQQRMGSNQFVEATCVTDLNFEDIISQKVTKYHISVCTTSNTGLLISNTSKLKNCVILDDSRPEAFPRIFSPKSRVVVLEGGLMKIPSVTVDSDFGFGCDENVFGCLSEAIILSLDQEQNLQPNVGEINFGNLYRLIDFCRCQSISAGDFLCGQRLIKPDELRLMASLEKENSLGVV